jgi:hypothetical protein
LVHWLRLSRIRANWYERGIVSDNMRISVNVSMNTDPVARREAVVDPKATDTLATPPTAMHAMTADQAVQLDALHKTDFHQPAYARHMKCWPIDANMRTRSVDRRDSRRWRKWTC